MSTNSQLPHFRLRGVTPPLITPLAGRDELDVPGLERLVEHVLAGGVHGLFVLGTTGEATSLSARLRRELISRVTRQVIGRTPVLVGVSDTSMVEALGLAEFAADAGAYAVVLSAPYYIPLDQRELLRYVELFAAESPLPVFLYNMPRLTKVSFAVETVRRALDISRIVGLKDSSGDKDYLREICSVTERREDWSLMIGSENLVEYGLRLGAHGCVPSGANLLPRLFTDAYQAAVSKNADSLSRLQQQITSLTQLNRFGAPESGAIRGIKCALERLSICSGRLADPLASCDPAESLEVEEILDRFGLLPEEGRRRLRGPHFNGTFDSTPDRSSRRIETK